MSLVRPCLVYKSVTGRPWRQLDSNAFRASLTSSAVYHLDLWAANKSELDVDHLAQQLLYCDEMIALPDKLVHALTAGACPKRGSLASRHLGFLKVIATDTY